MLLSMLNGVAGVTRSGYLFYWWRVSIYIRLKMAESPLFSKLKAEGKTSINPLKESFRHKGKF